MALYVINKINNKLTFFHHKDSFSSPAPKRLLCNISIQPRFDYASCSSWYPNLAKKIKHRIKTTQKKLMHFYLQLDKLEHIS